MEGFMLFIEILICGVVLFALHKHMNINEDSNNLIKIGYVLLLGTIVLSLLAGVSSLFMHTERVMWVPFLSIKAFGLFLIFIGDIMDERDSNMDRGIEE